MDNLGDPPHGSIVSSVGCSASGTKIPSMPRIAKAAVDGPSLGGPWGRTLADRDISGRPIPVHDSRRSARAESMANWLTGMIMCSNDASPLFSISWNRQKAEPLWHSRGHGATYFHVFCTPEVAIDSTEEVTNIRSPLSIAVLSPK
ncbi:hypothetical protein PCH_Pc21g05040 [Penicillium rubens Wisconsin 54-1255]|uniref:Uncharacterized protein n=1 Tax=Penicillium rubens (strain ATCC 28089 / DSM 1075 / NRRL 1951 / Wisconsin 54-1255) TaxID=500485 RepID=B6HN74_PENRW|nr:hypothetical protein PCH_Pc21g05040 [Penicillium rubens Wisconsin 54-1255]